MSRPIGRALIVANPSGRADVLSAMQRLGYGATELDDPYAAMAELCQRPLAYRALVLSLAGLYREELNLMPAVKRRFPHIEIWLSHTEGRLGALADAMRPGADGLLAEDGLHRLMASSTGGGEGTTTPPPSAASMPNAEMPASGPSPTFASATEITGGESEEPHPPAGLIDGPVAVNDPEPSGGEPVLTADELRALLHEQSPSPPEE